MYKKAGSGSGHGPLFPFVRLAADVSHPIAIVSQPDRCKISDSQTRTNLEYNISITPQKSHLHFPDEGR